LATPITPLHPPRRRLATRPTDGPGFVGRETERRTRAPWWGARRSPPQLLPCTRSSPVGPAWGLETSPRPNRNRSRPSLSGPPAKRSPVTKTRVHSTVSSPPVRVDCSTRPCWVGLPSRRPYGRDIAKRRDHRSRWGQRASAVYALAGENEHLFDQRIRLALTNEATPLGRSAGPRKRFPFSLVPGRLQRP